MLQSALIRSWLPFIAGLILSGVVVHLFWSNHSLEREKKIAEDWAANLEAVNSQLVQSREQSEIDRLHYLRQIKEKEGEINNLESDVAAGRKRLRVAAECVPTSGTDASGVGGRTAELTPAARQDYFALVRGMEQQYQLLQLCRADLRRRANGTR